MKTQSIFLAPPAFGLAFGLGLGLAAPVAAQAPAGAPAQAPAAGNAMTVGMAVKDTQGGDVGTITKVEPGFVTVKTDKHEARLPSSSFSPHNGALLFAMTRDQLNAAIEQQLAAQQSNIAPGAAVTDSSGGAVGTITAVDPQFVTVKLASGTEVRLPRAAVAPGSSGAVVGSTAAQLEAAAKAAAPPAAPAGPTGTPPPPPPSTQPHR
ncbi:MAG TPA: preprotein translocase subunit YajC [Allosphingosinicella sp.]